MAFDLEVQFSGLCLYVLDPANSRVGVLMPDARRTTANANHEDGTKGIPHVGYLRFELGDLNQAFPSAINPLSPTQEGVYQFDRETLVFKVTPAAAPMTIGNLNVPRFEDIAPDPADPGKSAIKVRNGLFTSTQPNQLLMRTILEGGTISGPTQEPWMFSNLFRPGLPTYQGKFASVVTWTRSVESATISLQPFGGGMATEFELKPRSVGGKVHLKVANFCSINPLEWDQMGTRSIDEDDEDFKWLYRLLMPTSGASWTQVLLGGHRFPIPMLPPPALRGQGVEDCIGAQINGSTT
jgi:hypothetical protein